MSSEEYFVEKSRPSAYVGLIPAAGVGSRLPGRKLSKEILPVGSAQGVEKPVIAHLLTSMHDAGVTHIRTVIRQEKQDVVDYLAGDEWHRIHFDNKTTAGTSSVTETVICGLHGLADRRIAFGFPDILFEPHDAFIAMKQMLNEGNANVVLGLFPTNNPGKMDMVSVDHAGQVVRIDIKPRKTNLQLTWILAVWDPVFSAFLCKQASQPSSATMGRSGEAHLGYAFQLAIAAGLQIRSVSFPAGRSLDIGTPDDLERARYWPG
jgi:glucose-1-phosphate thymidylyltransferase